mgnify:CR=1 FL=1
MGRDDELRSVVCHSVHVLQQSQLPLCRERGFGFVHKIETLSRVGQEYLQESFAMRHLMQTGKSSAMIIFTSLRRQGEVAFRAQLDGPIAYCRYIVIALARSDVSSYVLKR